MALTLSRCLSHAAKFVGIVMVVIAIVVWLQPGVLFYLEPLQARYFPPMMVESIQGWPVGTAPPGDYVVTMSYQAPVPRPTFRFSLIPPFFSRSGADINGAWFYRSRPDGTDRQAFGIGPTSFDLFARPGTAGFSFRAHDPEDIVPMQHIDVNGIVREDPDPWLVYDNRAWSRSGNISVYVAQGGMGSTNDVVARVDGVQKHFSFDNLYEGKFPLMDGSVDIGQASLHAVSVSDEQSKAYFIGDVGTAERPMLAIWTLDLSDGEWKRMLVLRAAEVDAYVLEPDSGRLAVADFDDSGTVNTVTVRTYDLWTGKALDVGRLGSGDSSVPSMRLSPDGLSFAVSVRGNEIEIFTWDGRAHRRIPAIASDIIVWVGGYIAARDAAGDVTVIDAQSGTAYPVHDEFISLVHVSP